MRRGQFKGIKRPYERALAPELRSYANARAIKGCCLRKMVTLVRPVRLGKKHDNADVQSELGDVRMVSSVEFRFPHHYSASCTNQDEILVREGKYQGWPKEDCIRVLIMKPGSEEVYVSSQLPYSVPQGVSSSSFIGTNVFLSKKDCLTSDK